MDLLEPARDKLIDSGIALSRPIALDRALNEAAQQIRRAIPFDAIAIAVIDERTAVLHVAHSTGYGASAARIEERLTPVWQEAIDAANVTVHRDSGLELTAPFGPPEHALGA